PYTIYRTNNGPIFSTDPSAGIAFSMDFTSWMKEYKSLQGFSELGSDTTLAQFRSSMSKIVTLHNFMYADRQGNIAFFSDGLVPASPSPLSTSADPRLPHLGNGSQQWNTFIPFAQMPHSVNPGQGYLENWNTKPSQQLFYQQNGGEEYWGTSYHSQPISQMLSASTHITLGYLQQVEHSIGTIDNNNTRDAAPYFIPFLERAYQKLVAAGDPMVNAATHPDLAPAMQALTTWNATMPSGNPPTLGSPAMSIFVQFLQALDLNAFSAGANAGEQYVGGVNFNNGSLGLGTYGGPDGMAPLNMLLHILAGTNGLVPCNTLCYQGHYFGGHRDHVLVESLNDAIAILSGTGPQLGHSANGFGTTNIAAWGWEPSQSIQWDNLDPVASAAGVTVNCGTSAAQERSSYFLAMDMARVPFGQQLMPPGESGFINAAGVPSPHFCDQVGAFNNFTYFPISSSITGVSPAQGPAGGGSTVVITGHNLTGATAVDFGNQAASSFQVVSSTEITAVAPAGTGTVDIRVVTPADPGGTAANSFDRFTYVASPATTSVEQPVAGAIVRGGIWLDAAASSPGGIRSVSFLLSGGTVRSRVVAAGTLTADGWLAGWDSSTVANGTYSIQSVATTPSGASATSLPVSITVANTPLATAVLVPEPGARITGSVVLDATAAGEHPVRAVTFRISGGSGSRPVRAAARLTLYGWIVELPAGSLAPGAYTVESIATDTAGHRATSAPVTFTVG
ncbi:MAG: penicillin acylase family protein, partial [Acidimicrobiales bacterium]